MKRTIETKDRRNRLHMVHMIPFSKIKDTYEGKRILKKDACGKPTVAVIFNGATMIAVCKDCLGKMKAVVNNIE